MARSSQPQPISTGWNSISRITGIVIFLLILGCMLVPFIPRLRSYRAVDARAKLVEAERDALKEKLGMKTAAIQLVQQDAGYIEIQARDHLDMCRPGEVIFQVDSRIQPQNP